MYKSIKKNKNLFLMALILIFALVLRLIFFSGVDSSDSIFYTEFADSYSKNTLELTKSSSTALRVGFIFPVSVLYSLFGVNEFSSSILSLIFSLASIILIYHLGKFIFNEKVGLLGAFLLSFFPLDVMHATMLMTDLPSAFFVALSIFIFLKAEKFKQNITSNIYYFLSGISLSLAYLIKELSLLIGLFFLVYVIYHKKIKIQYSLIALGFLIILSLELLFIFNMTGDPFFRFKAIDEKTLVSVVGGDYYGRGSFPSSLFHYPYIFFTDQSLGLFYPFIFIAIFFCIVNKRKETYNLLLWFVPLILYISFGSMSLTQYVPIPATGRFLYMLTYPGILLLAYFLTQEKDLIKRILMPSIVILLLVTSIGFNYISDRSPLKNERVAYQYIKILPEVYTDYRTIKIFGYLSGYENYDNIKKFHNYDADHPENRNALNLDELSNAYIVINHRLVNFFISSKKGIVFPNEIFDIPDEWILKKTIGTRENRIDVYYIPQKEDNLNSV